MMLRGDLKFKLITWRHGDNSHFDLISKSIFGVLKTSVTDRVVFIYRLLNATHTDS